MTLARKTLVLLSALVLSTCALSPFALAEGTRTWEQSKFDELIKGTPKGVALRSEGGLELAPVFKALATTPSTYIWSIASDSGGNIYAATAPDGKVYRIAPVKAPAPAQAGAKAFWSATPYFDPGSKYIWDIVLDNAGALYVATGDRGEIYKISPNGQHSLFFKSDEVHIRVLALDPKGNLIAGSDGSGLVYRISPSGDAFVLYGAPKKEITALAIDSAGNIYAAGAGEKHPSAAPSSYSSTSVPTGPTPSTSSIQQPGIVINAPQPSTSNVPANLPSSSSGAGGGSEIYRIAPDGSPNRIWTSREDLVYSLAFDQRGRLLAGTGNRGHIFAIGGEDEFTDLLKASATQVTAL